MSTAIVRSRIDDVTDRLADALSLIAYTPERQDLFIKPNVPDSGPPDRGLYTDPRVVEALLRLYAGRRVVIGEGCIVGRNASEAFGKCGYAELAARYGAELVDLEQAPRFETEWEFGRLRLPELLATHEYINVAKLKTHVQTGVTLGIKSQKGLLLAKDKRGFHRRDLNASIRALARAVRPTLTVIDGIVGLEGNGPWMFGAAKPAGLLFAGTDMVQVDNVALRVMGFAPEHAPHIPSSASIETVGLGIEQALTPFRYDFCGYYVYKGCVYEHFSDSCSGCNATLYQAFRRVRPEDWQRIGFVRRGHQRLDLVLGHGPAELPADAGMVVCIGDCARDFAARHGAQLVRGCPPEPESLTESLLEPEP